MIKKVIYFSSFSATVFVALVLIQIERIIWNSFVMSYCEG